MNERSPYRLLWVFTFFDLPTLTKKQRKAYSDFRKKLMKDGFIMMQYSVYIRHCSSYENANAHIKRIEKYLPKQGKVTMMTITDKQFEKIQHYWGVERAAPPETPQQLTLF